ncbi:MAG: N-acetylglucosamine-6-phosphate deacetylase [Ktedonobacteraceae bacterium]
MRFTLRNARLVDATMDQAANTITIDGAYIQRVGHGDDAEENVIDASDTIITPGFIEVHTHGGGGFNLHTTDVHEILSYARWIPTTGVTSFLIAVVGTPNALPEQQLRTAVNAIEQHKDKPGAEPLGIHLEGPYINEKRRGAHPPSWLRLPNEHETTSILELTKKYLKLVTLAPELPGAEQLIRQLVAAGVTVSIGHTDANFEQTQAAIQLGVTHATHCFNAMPPLLHREPGPIAAIAQACQVYGEVIADGVHVHPAVVDMLVRMLGPERVVVVTDAQSVAGVSGNSTFEFAGQQAHVAHGAACLADGTLAGSVLTMDKALHNILTMTHVSLSEVVAMLTLNPAQSAHVAAYKGKLQTGYDADLLLFDSSLTLQATICRGKITFATETWRDRLKDMVEPSVGV